MRVLVALTLAALLSCIFAQDTCNQFDLSAYGAKKPVVTASASGSTVTITVGMLRQTSDNTGTPIFHDIDTTPSTSNICHMAANNLVASAGVSWVKTSDSCTDTYTLTQSLSDIIDSTSNNNWGTGLVDDGRTVQYTLPIYATYSVNNNGDCYYVGFKSKVTFQTKLSVASTSSSFVTADNSARFTFSGLRVTSANVLEIAGTMYPLVPSSTLKNFALQKTIGGYSFTVAASDCSDATNGCAQTYSIAVPTIQAGGNDISGQYDNTMDVWENGVVTRVAVKLSYTLSYTIPTDPSVVDSDTISTGTALYTDNTYTTPRVSSYQSGSATPMYIENKIVSGPAIPADYRLRMAAGYICCVAYGTSISPYNPTTGLGGCQDGSGKLEQVSLGVEGATSGVQLFTSATSGNPTRYRLQVLLSNIFSTTNHAAPMSCEVLLVSKLEDTSQQRRAQDSKLATTYVSTIPMLIEAKATVSSASTFGVALSVIALVAVMFL